MRCPITYVRLTSHLAFFGPCLCASRPGSGCCCMLGSGARQASDVRQLKLQSCCASTCSATNEVCQYYQSALCGSLYVLLCFVLASYATAAFCHNIWLAGPVLIWADAALIILIVLRACSACVQCMPACIAWHHPRSVHIDIERSCGPLCDQALASAVGRPKISLSG